MKNRRLALLIVGMALGWLAGETSAAESARVTMRTIEIKTYNENQNVKITWPVVSGKYDRDVLEAVNQRLFDSFFDLSAGVKPKEKPAHPMIAFPTPEGTYTKDDGTKAAFPLPYQMFVEAEVKYNQHDILCLKRRFYCFTGGAHGMTYDEYTVFDMANGKPLALSDVLVKGYEKPLEALVNEFVPRENLFKPQNPVLLKDSSDWFIAEKGLCIHYGLYALAPYAVGMIDVEMPFEKAKSLIDPNGPLSFLKKQSK